MATLEQAEIPIQMVQSSTTGEEATIDVEKLEQLSQLVDGTETDLGSGEREKFIDLLCSFEDIFARSNSDLGMTSILKHSINTGNATPVRQPVRRLPPHYRDNVRQLLGEMLENDVVEKSTSPWASPIVLVAKKTDRYAFVSITGRLTRLHARMPTRCLG